MKLWLELGARSEPPGRIVVRQHRPQRCCGWSTKWSVDGNILGFPPTHSHFWTLSNQGVLGTTISGIFPSGNLNFTFGGGGVGSSYAILGHFPGIFIPSNANGTYDLVLGLDRSGLRRLSRRAEIVFCSAREPSTWAMLLIGFGGIWFMGYRRKHDGSRAEGLLSPSPGWSLSSAFSA
jgi:hypothetical protein